MTPERWKRANSFFQQAVDLSPEARVEFLAHACGEDGGLLSEVQSLIEAHEKAGSFLLALTQASDVERGEAPRLPAGARLGPYEIVTLLASGGMGEVFRARDSRLGRDVAIKVVARHALTGAGAARRLEREARAVAALNHPNILAVYDVGLAGELFFVVSELLEGETLRDALRGGALPWPAVLDLARQLAAGLAAAHDKGIVHRDLKPENLFLTRDGRLKILDFGLARHTSLTTTPPDPAALTEPGAVLGTVGYMSPEQVRGQPADARSDVFSFGVVLYEMLAGVRAFRGGSAVETMNAILVEEPPRLGSPGLPSGAGAVVRRCLRKQAAERYDSGRDLVRALEGAQTGPNDEVALHTPVPAASGRGPRLEAYQLYVKGLHFWNKRHEGGLQQATRAFEQAIERDPAYAPAHAALADTHAILGLSLYDALPAREAMPKAKAAALRAIELDPELAAPHATLGWVLLHYDWEWAAAEAEFARALQLDPLRATTHHWRGFLLSALGRQDEARAAAHRAWELEPLSLIINSQLCQAAYYAGRFDDVIASARNVIEMEPGFLVGHFWLGVACAAQGRWSEAVAVTRSRARGTGRGRGGKSRSCVRWRASGTCPRTTSPSSTWGWMKRTRPLRGSTGRSRSDRTRSPTWALSLCSIHCAPIHNSTLCWRVWPCRPRRGVS